MACAGVPIDLDGDISDCADNNVDAFAYDEAEIQYLSSDDEDESLQDPTHTDLPFPMFIDLPSVELPWGTVKKGETVELKKNGDSRPGRLSSGDFLRVMQIVEYLETGEIKLRGQLFRRTAYHRPLFGSPHSKGTDDKAGGDLNEVFMLEYFHPNDPRTPNLRKYEEIGPEDVIGKRELVITNTPFPLLSFLDMKNPLPRPMDKAETKKYLFSHGRLVCRWVYICFLNRSKIQSKITKDVCHEAEIRAPYKRECDDLPDSHRIIKTTVTKHFRGAQSQSRHVYTGSIQTVNNKHLHKPQLPCKHERITFADFFCGAGLATQGAMQAGLKPVFAVEKFDNPAEAYANNFPSIPLLQMDAADFTGFADRQNFKVHICHFSCPCQYWSSVHTVAGKNDLDNIRCTYAPSPIAEKIEPPILTFEQAPGFCTQSKHKFFFREFINSLLRIDYNVRWKIQDLVEYGVPSRRRRLLIIAAKKGIPLPPFPRPTHGGPGTGLEPFVTIYEAEEPLRRQRDHDEWHNPENSREYNEKPFDPRTSQVKNVITTNGGDYNYHYSGKRRATVREAAYYQCCPPGFNFAGSRRDAMIQVGNGYPCNAAEQHFLTCAQTLEAFYNGFIDAEEHITDLYETLRDKGIRIQQQPQSDGLFGNFDSTPSRLNRDTPPFRYLSRLVQTDAIASTHNTFGRTIDLGRPEEQRSHNRNKRPAVPHSLIEISDSEDDENEVEVIASRPKKRSKTRDDCRDGRELNFWDGFQGKTIELEDSELED